MSFYPKKRDYIIHYPNIKMVKARKSYTCEVCGCEIPDGDYYWTYKPYPVPPYWYGWRKRCLDHKPVTYEEVLYYHDDYAKTIQIKRFASKTIIKYNRGGYSEAKD